MNEMTLLSRHRLLNSCPGRLRLRTVPLGHRAHLNIESLRVSREETFCFIKTSMAE